MGSRILHLVRHGDYVENQALGQFGGSLTERGERQAKNLADLFSTVRLSAIHSSPAPRAFETAQQIAKRHPGLDVQRHRALFECTPSIPPDVTPWGTADELSSTAVSNCQQMLDRQFDLRFKPALRNDVHEVLVCHGNVVRYFVTRVLDAEADSWVRMRCSQASVTRVMIRRAAPRFSLESLNDLSHLPRNLRAVDD